MNVDLVDWPANPKLRRVPLLKLFCESLLMPRFSFCLLDKIVFGVTLLAFILDLLKGFA